MPNRTSVTGSELFIVDNSDTEWKVKRYLHDWCQISKSIDIATGYFEIGALLELKDEWQKVDKIRILMGDECSLRTRNAFEQGLQSITTELNYSLEAEKDKNDFLTGVTAIVTAIRSKIIECRVYRKDKFHAKAYITHARLEVVGSSALVGSSNFTFPGLTENIELNIQITGRPVTVLQEWYDEHWNEAEDVTAEILRVIERHVQQYLPFDVYAKALHEFFRGHELTAGEWEKNQSKVFPILAGYQQQGYQTLLATGNKHGGALLCDGVGLGKTFVGLMLIERLVVKERLNVVLFVPKSAREAVWERALEQRLPHIFGKFSKLEVFNHTDLMRGGQTAKDLESVRERAHVIIIDEAHHFRNTGTKGGETPEERKSRYWKLYDIAAGKKMYMLTATPINNRLVDLQHMIELFSRHQADYFKDAPLGIHSLPGHFRTMEKNLEKAVNAIQPPGEDLDVETNLIEAEQVLEHDALFKELVVQRSRAYVKKSLEQSGSTVMFPQPREPQVVGYSVKQTYGKLLKLVETAFNKEKPLFALPIYYPLAYYKGPDANIKPLDQGRQKQVVSLIRTGFLKRFESSAEAFTESCKNLMFKLLAWLKVHAETKAEKRAHENWLTKHKDITGYETQQHSLFMAQNDEDAEEDFLPPEMLEAVEKLPRDEYKVEEIIFETIEDLNQIVEFLDLLKDFKPANDKKLVELKKLLKKDAVLKEHKVLIFSEFMDTARYLKSQLIADGFTEVEEIDSGTGGKDRFTVIQRFSPYYNGTTSAKLQEAGLSEIRILISTDVLSEGLNLQDCTRLINYDLHWNPVRLMQRIGRVDRRMDPKIEAQIVADHPEQKKLRGEVKYWNFLPPDDLDDLLKLYQKVAKKTLRISKTFGIEGRKLLKPDDDYDDLRDFMTLYEGSLTPEEAMNLEYKKLLAENPGLAERLDLLPGRVFSGKAHIKKDSRAAFFCYALPAKKPVGDGTPDTGVWSAAAGPSQWYLYDLKTDKIVEDAAAIHEFIRCKPDAPRQCAIEQKTLSEVRAKVDKHIKSTYLKKVDAPAGVKPALKAWMELN